MEFLNIGGGELLVIVLLALVLFGPEDIMKLMQSLGKYTRRAREMWSEFSSTMQQEYASSEELTEVVEETKATVAEAQAALSGISETVGDISTSVKSDVAAAERAVKTQAAETASILKKPIAIDGVPSWKSPPPRTSESPDAEVDEGEPTDEPEATPRDPDIAEVDSESTDDADPAAEDGAAQASEPASLASTHAGDEPDAAELDGAETASVTEPQTLSTGDEDA